MVYADWKSVPGTFSWPNDLWYREDKQLAALPLHDPIFFGGSWETANSGPQQNEREGGTVPAQSTARKGKREREKKPPLPKATPEESSFAKVVRAEGIPREYDFYTGGTMAWVYITL